VCLRDFSKAVDFVVHSKFVLKLLPLVFKVNCCIGLLLFMVEPKFIRVGKFYSDPCDVISGVPQGSVLGPLYMVLNNINDSGVLQSGLDALQAWSCIWQLNISVPKCMVLQLGNNNAKCRPNYTINAIPLPNVSVAKDLSVLIDSDLKFSSHIDIIVTKAHQRASLILRCFKCRNPDLLFQAFVTYVRPLLEFNCQVW